MLNWPEHVHVNSCPLDASYFLYTLTYVQPNTHKTRSLPYSSTPFSLVSLFLKIPPSDLFRLLLVRVVNIDGNFGKEEKSNSACNLLALPIVAVEMTCKNSSVRPPPSTHTIVDMRLLVRVCVCVCALDQGEFIRSG